MWLQLGVEMAAYGLPCSLVPLGGLSLLFAVRGGPSFSLLPEICPLQTPEDLQGPSALPPPWLATGASPPVPDEWSSFLCMMLLVQHLPPTRF